MKKVLVFFVLLMAFSSARAGNIFVTKYDYQADTKIYFVDYDYQADLKVFFVKYDYQAKWNNSSKWQGRLK